MAPVASVEGASETLAAHFDVHFLQHMIVMGFVLEACALRRDEAVRRAHDFDHFLIVWLVSGRLDGILGSRTTTVDPGDIAVFDLARDFIVQVRQGCEGAALIVPRQLFAVPRGDPGFHGATFTGDRIATKLAGSQITLLRELAAKGDAGTASEAVAAMTASLEVVFAPLRHSQASIAFDRRDRSLLGKMCRHVEQHLGDPKLDVESLAEAFAVSRATVYRIFARHGGVAAYIRNIRLDQAFDQIRHAPHNVERLNMLARRFGFTSGDSFARAFQARFGIRPVQLHTGGADALRAANRQRRQADRADIGVFEGWLLDIAADLPGRGS